MSLQQIPGHYVISSPGSVDSATCSAIASAYAESAASGKLDSTASSSFYPSDNPSGFISSVDLSDYATTAYVDSSISGFAYNSAVSGWTAKQDALTFGYDAEDKISGINGSAIAGGGVKTSPSGTLLISGASAESTDSAFIPGKVSEIFVQSGIGQVGTIQPLTIAGANKITIQNGSWFDGTIYVSGNGTLVSSVAHAANDWPQTFTAAAPISIGADGWFDVNNYSAFNIVSSPDQVVPLMHQSAIQSAYASASATQATAQNVLYILIPDGV